MKLDNIGMAQNLGVSEGQYLCDGSLEDLGLVRGGGRRSFEGELGLCTHR